MIPFSEAAGNLRKAALGLKRRRAINRIAGRYRPRISAFFRSQKTATLDKFSQFEYLFTESFRQLSEESTQLTLANWLQLWEEIEGETSPELRQLLSKAEADGLIGGATFAQQGVGIPGFSFNLANPRAVKWFADHAGSLDYIKGIQTTTRDQLHTIITKAIDTGQSYSQTAKEISGRFDDFSRERAQLIATHESAQAYESGSFLAEQEMVDAGIQLEKSWENSGDDKVSDGCLENSAAGWIPFDQSFPSGDMYPPRFPGCRCWHIVRQVGRE